MSYARSAAFKLLQGRLGDLRRTIVAAGRLRVGGKRNKLYRESMLSSSMLLGFAYFEAYIADVVDDFCKAICSKGVTADRFPEDLRAHITIAANLKNWVGIQDPSKQRAQINAGRKKGVFDLLNDQNRPVQIDAAALLAGVSYPKPANVRKLLSRLGIQDPIAQLVARGGHSIEQKLVSIHDVRTELAHTGTMPSWTLSDYENRIDGLEEFAKAVDKVLHRQVSSIASASSWIV